MACVNWDNFAHDVGSWNVRLKNFQIIRSLAQKVSSKQVKVSLWLKVTRSLGVR
jgi:hypothetical protein